MEQEQQMRGPAGLAPDRARRAPKHSDHQPEAGVGAVVESASG
jgi:hypothetical protein